MITHFLWKTFRTLWCERIISSFLHIMKAFTNVTTAIQFTIQLSSTSIDETIQTCRSFGRPRSFSVPMISTLRENKTCHISVVDSGSRLSGCAKLTNGMIRSFEASADWHEYEWQTTNGTRSPSWEFDVLTTLRMQHHGGNEKHNQIARVTFVCLRSN